MGMQKLSQKWCIVSLLDPANDEFEFDWKDWPLHVTLAPTFAIDLSSAEIAALLDNLFAEQKAMATKAAEELTWASKVIRLERTEELQNLQLRTVEALTDNGAVFNEPQYVADNYIPHSTVQASGSLQIGDEVALSSFSLVDMFPDGDGARRKIVKTFKLM